MGLFSGFMVSRNTKKIEELTFILHKTKENLEEVIRVNNENKVKLIAEKSFSNSLMESSPDCLKVLDKEGRIQFMNFNGLCQMEIDDFSQIKNKPWHELWGKENEGLALASIDKALKGESCKFTASCKTFKGNTKIWDVLVSPVGELGEPVKQIISVSRVITQ